MKTNLSRVDGVIARPPRTATPTAPASVGFTTSSAHEPRTSGHVCLSRASFQVSVTDQTATIGVVLSS